VYHNVTRSRSSDDSAETEKKERVIHTRVPESLEAELRQKAQDLGISVSNLVRNVLGHAFGLVGDMVADSHAIARAARAARRADAGEPAVPERNESGESDVLGWQPMVLGKNAVCARCNDLLPRGSDAAIGIPEAGGSRLVICLVCLEQLRVPPATTEEPR